MKIRLVHDSRDAHAYQVFGQPIALVDIESSLSFDDPAISQKIQPIGDVECTCYSAEYVAQNKTKVEYDITELFNRIPHNAFGADPRDVLGEVVKNGLRVKATGELVKPFNSYFRADTGNFDAFDNTRVNMKVSESPVMIWTSWYQEWCNLAPNSLMPIGKKKISGHMYAGLGWIDGENFVIEFWGGYTLRMPRATFNSAIKEDGCGTAIFSTYTMDEKRKRNLKEWILDLLKNLLLLVQQSTLPPTPPPVEVKVPPVEKNPSENMYDLAYSLIGRHLTMDSTVPSLYGCAEAVSYLFNELGLDIPKKGIASTVELEKWLIKNCTEVKEPQTGDIIISVSYTGTTNSRGHVGVVGLKAIMSNDSLTGLWQPYWSLKAWLLYFKGELKLRTRYFRP